MDDNQKVKIRLPSGCNVDMSLDIYDNYYCDFAESQYLSFNHFINAGLYFPQIMQFIAVLITLLHGKTSCSDILLSNIISGTTYILIWFLAKLYKIPGLSFISCLIGGNIFRYFLHFIPLAIISFFVVKDWKVLLFCAIGGIITLIIRTILFALLSNVRYHDEIVKYVATFKHNLKEESNPPQNINKKDVSSNNENFCNRSLSMEGETPKTYGNYNVYGTDIALQKDTAPINNTQKDYKTLVTDDIAPIVKTIIQSEISTEPPKQTAPIFNEKVYFSQLFSDIYDAFLNFRNSIECVLIGYGLKNFLSSNEKFFSVITVSFFMQLVEFEVKTKFKEEYILEQKALTEAMLQEIAEAEQLSYDKLNNFYSETKKKSCFNLPDNEKPRLHKVANTFFDTLLSLQFEIQKPSSDAIKDITEQFYVMVENIKKTL